LIRSWGGRSDIGRFEKLIGERIVFPTKGVVEIEEYEITPPESGEVLIATVSSLISTGTELAALNQLSTPIQPWSLPFYPGDGSAGVVVAVGEGVTAFQESDRVATLGGHASHVTLTKEIVRIPPGISFDLASLSTLGVTSLHGVRRARIQLGESVLVIGQGIVGQLAFRFAKLEGAAPVIVADYFDKRLAMAAAGGADLCLNPGEGDLVSMVHDVTGGHGVNVVIEATGNPKAFSPAFKAAANGGRIVALGSTRGLVRELDIYSDLHRRGLILVGAHYNTCPVVGTTYYPWTRDMLRGQFLEWIATGKLHISDLVTHRVPFHQAPAMYSMLSERRGDAMAVILNWPFPSIAG